MNSFAERLSLLEMFCDEATYGWADDHPDAVAEPKPRQDGRSLRVFRQEGEDHLGT